MKNMDPETRELVELLGKAIVPIGKRRTVVHIKNRSPYYTDSRYKRI